MPLSVSFFLIISIFPMTYSVFLVNAANAQSTSYFYPQNEKPFGLSYPEWAAKWTKFVFEYPSKDARVNDPNGSLCAVNQTSQVWILPGASSGKFTRKCTIPFGTSILISPTDTFCNKKDSP